MVHANSDRRNDKQKASARPRYYQRSLLKPQRPTTAITLWSNAGMQNQLLLLSQQRTEFDWINAAFDVSAPLKRSPFTKLVIRKVTAINIHKQVQGNSVVMPTATEKTIICLGSRFNMELHYSNNMRSQLSRNKFLASLVFLVRFCFKC